MNQQSTSSVGGSEFSAENVDRFFGQLDEKVRQSPREASVRRAPPGTNCGPHHFVVGYAGPVRVYRVAAISNREYRWKPRPNFWI
jgi:hypothetical protein